METDKFRQKVIQAKLDGYHLKYQKLPQAVQTMESQN